MMRLKDPDNPAQIAAIKNPAIDDRMYYNRLTKNLGIRFILPKSCCFLLLPA